MIGKGIQCGLSLKKLAVHNARIEYLKYTEKVSSTKFTEILQSIHDNKEGL